MNVLEYLLGAFLILLVFGLPLWGYLFGRFVLRPRRERRGLERAKAIGVSEALAVDQLLEGGEVLVAVGDLHEEVERWCRENGLGRVAAEIAELAQRACRLVPAPRSGRVSKGGSKLGGLPDLPQGVDWPRDAAGVPLTFLAQIQLTAARVAFPDYDHRLPHEGWLYAFWDEKSFVGQTDGVALVHFDGAESELRQWRERPEGMPSPDTTAAADSEDEDSEDWRAWVLPEVALAFEPVASLPHPDSQLLPELALSADENESYLKLLEAVAYTPFFQLLGYAMEVQDDPAEEAALAELGLDFQDLYGPTATERHGERLSEVARRVEEEMPYWEPVLQLEGVGPFFASGGFGDVGTLYLMARSRPGEGMSRLDLARVRAVMQSH